MHNRIWPAVGIAVLALALAGCNDPQDQDSVTAEQSFGPSPTLPAPQHSWMPTVNVAAAVGWPAGGKPTAANGMAVNAFATGLDHPRSLYVLPNGDVLVAETNAPPKPDDTSGHQGLDRENGHGPRRRRHDQRQPHHAAARHRRRRRRRYPERSSQGPQLAVRHGAGRRRSSMSPTPMRSCASPIMTATPKSPRPA